MDRVECFWLEPTELGRSELRRYLLSAIIPESQTSQTLCRHDTTVYIGDIPYPFSPEGYVGYGQDDVPHDDPRWPTKCHVCGTVFRDDAEWQHNVRRLFKGAPDGKLYTTRNAPPGAMFDASWYPLKGPDGIALAVALPPDGGDDIWIVDMPSSSEGHWTRTGTVPKVTARPSILTPRYHGFLTDGWLVSV
jgi:hypothetical protein